MYLFSLPPFEKVICFIIEKFEKTIFELFDYPKISNVI
jgi:hypothetical protein